MYEKVVLLLEKKVHVFFKFFFTQVKNAQITIYQLENIEKQLQKRR